MNKQPSNPNPNKQSRQSAYIARKRDAGYAPLSSVFVPKAIADECREMIRNHVAEYESKLANQF